jgi:hypothetical protein
VAVVVAGHAAGQSGVASQPQGTWARVVPALTVPGPGAPAGRGPGFPALQALLTADRAEGTGGPSGATGGVAPLVAAHPAEEAGR